MNKKNYLTSRQVAKKFNVSIVTIKNWVRKYHLPCSITAGGFHRFSEANVESIKTFIRERWGLTGV